MPLAVGAVGGVGRVYGQEVLVWWCVVFGGIAVVGYGASLAGVTRGRRAVRVLGRMVEFDVPVHGGSEGNGIPVVVSFQDPSTGEEFTLPYEGRSGDLVETAWKGREIGIRYRPGRPEEFAVTHDLSYGRYGVCLPNLAVLLVYAALVTSAALTSGYPWALLGVGVPWTVATMIAFHREVLVTRRRVAELTAAPTVPGRIVAVTKSVHTDDDGTFVAFNPVVTFTTREDTAVTGFCPFDLVDPSRSRGRDVTVHYLPTDPAVFTLDLAHNRRDLRSTVRFDGSLLLAGVAAVVVGVLQL
ncbi:DUF3592 domain-containing protein [Streptomyces sp. NPDC057137]|uniref:DUF3592 domain-containing protein n=1 Tax=Streptomyces sp. NPDC057137 TaxID=3346030 RepID=UPI0036394C4E